ncbi:BadF/BadG/BcrA/BcrD ATPase family protein [Kineococcus rhizosphaerae]|uniref:Glucosamine kinase n=1 Tax=Kineococcus rhizosphaerae TaxID=559628 RepID=A0A2T0R0D0_9ACTN|nr:BadF/BadG/BcrA/BcrD ATPase family protein [Kineococcus rhizosphaerae]PRY12589.1 glucosamine kinase [Kineococcus rhizosphaerae]
MSRRRLDFVLAVDSGGTGTRVGCFALDGRLLASATGPGGAHQHDDTAAANLTGTVAAALDGLDPAGARAFAAGVSGIARAGSNQGGLTADEARAFYPLPDLACPTVFVNDAVVAHRGALAGRAGVVVVAGTGSMVLAIDVDGREVESGQFQHYAGGARHVVFDAVHRLLTGPADPADAGLRARVEDHFGGPDLRTRLLALAESGYNDVKRRYGDLAPAVTALAGSSPVADRALRSLADATATGVLLLAPLTGVDPVPVGCVGSLAEDPAFRVRLGDALAGSRAELVPTQLGALGGAAFTALQLAGVRVDPAVLDRLRTGMLGA